MLPYKEFGTPLYTFDLQVLRERIGWMRNHLPDNVDLCYAVKANPFIVEAAADMVDRLEICSPGEARICLAAGVPEEKMVISGVYKTPAFIEELVLEHPSIGIYTAESVQQYDLLAELAERYEQTLHVLLRLTSGNQFGMSEAEVEALLSKDSKWLHICGIQFFSGTQKTSLKKTTRELKKLDAFLQAHSVEELEFGTGFPVSYFEGETFDEEAYFVEFTGLLQQMQSPVKIILEVGRSIAASCGTYYTQVVDTKINNEGRFAIVDGGIHQIAYYGQFMAMKRPRMQIIRDREDLQDDVCSPKTPDEASDTRWTICGSLCTINDLLVKQLPADNLAPGDILAFEKAGAYCVTEGISLFLSRDLPAVCLIHEDGQAELVRDHIEIYPFNQ